MSRVHRLGKEINFALFPDASDLLVGNPRGFMNKPSKISEFYNIASYKKSTVFPSTSYNRTMKNKTQIKTKTYLNTEI